MRKSLQLQAWISNLLSTLFPEQKKKEPTYGDEARFFIPQATVYVTVQFHYKPCFLKGSELNVGLASLLSSLNSNEIKLALEEISKGNLNPKFKEGLEFLTLLRAPNGGCFETPKNVDPELLTFEVPVSVTINGLNLNLLGLTITQQHDLIYNNLYELMLKTENNTNEYYFLFEDVRQAEYFAILLSNSLVNYNLKATPFGVWNIFNLLYISLGDRHNKNFLNTHSIWTTKNKRILKLAYSSFVNELPGWPGQLTSEFTSVLESASKFGSPLVADSNAIMAEFVSNEIVQSLDYTGTRHLVNFFQDLFLDPAAPTMAQLGIIKFNNTGILSGMAELSIIYGHNFPLFNSSVAITLSDELIETWRASLLSHLIETNNNNNNKNKEINRLIELLTLDNFYF